MPQNETMNKEKTNYSQAFKIKAVELSNLRGELLEVARELNISRDVLKRWKRAFREGKLRDDLPSKRRSPEEEEIMRLRKALYESNLERDILKKAVAIFSTKDR